MVTIKKIAPMSLAKVMGLLYALMGFAGGLFVLAMTLFSGPPEGVSGPAVHLFGLAAPLLATTLYGAAGFVLGYAGAWLYNVIATKMGGISLKIETQSPPDA